MDAIASTSSLQARTEAERKRRRNASQRKWNKANPEKVRAANRRNFYKWRYGITFEERNAILEKQGGRCAACGTTDPGSKVGWVVDHSHKTKKVRGITCPHCNCGIGYAKDSVDILKKWISYLESNEDD